MENICRTLWLLYLCIAPVYWLPYLPAELFLSGKKALFGVATITGFLYLVTKGRVRLSFKICGASGLLLLFLSFLPGLVLGIPESAMKLMMNLSFAACTFICFHALMQGNSKNLLFFSYSSLFIGTLGFYTALAKVGIVTDYHSPGIFDTTSSTSGFTGLRTGWSNGISFYIPFAVYLIVTHEAKLIKILGFVAILGIFLSQVAVAGRAGMLSSMFACLFLILFYANHKQKVVFFTIIIVAFMAYLPVLFEHLRLDRIEGGIDQESLNHFSAGRIGSYLYALEHISQNPLTGVGFGNTDIRGHSIHNMLLRLTAETGLLFLITFIAIIAGALRQFKRMRKNKGTLILLAIVMQGLITSQFEPSMLLPAFQNSTIWWAAIGMIAALPFLKRGTPKARPNLLEKNNSGINPS